MIKKKHGSLKHNSSSGASSTHQPRKQSANKSLYGSYAGRGNNKLQHHSSGVSGAMLHNNN